MISCNPTITLFPPTPIFAPSILSLPTGSHQFVLLSLLLFFVLFAALLYFSDSTYRWHHTVFVFVCLAYCTQPNALECPVPKQSVAPLVKTLQGPSCKPPTMHPVWSSRAASESSSYHAPSLSRQPRQPLSLRCPNLLPSFELLQNILPHIFTRVLLFCFLFYWLGTRCEMQPLRYVCTGHSTVHKCDTVSYRIYRIVRNISYNTVLYCRHNVDQQIPRSCLLEWKRCAC